MDIAALSMGLSQAKVHQEANVSILKKAMDSSEAQAAEMLKIMEANMQIMEEMVSPHLGGNVDVRA